MSTTATGVTVTTEELSPQEARAAFDARCRELLGISGEQFLVRFRSGDAWDESEEPAVSELSLLLPFAR